jgi:hypothetical protein
VGLLHRACKSLLKGTCKHQNSTAARAGLRDPPKWLGAPAAAPNYALGLGSHFCSKGQALPLRPLKAHHQQDERASQPEQELADGEQR